MMIMDNTHNTDDHQDDLYDDDDYVSWTGEHPSGETGSTSPEAHAPKERNIWHDLSPDNEHALRIPPEEVKTIDGRNGEILKSQTCKVCSGHDIMAASKQQMYRHGCKNCRNTIDGLPFFPVHSDDWYKNKGSYGHKSSTWKAYVTTYRKELVRLKIVKPVAALLLEFISDRCGRGGTVKLSVTQASHELAVKRDTIYSHLEKLEACGAVKNLSRVDVQGSASDTYAVLLAPLEKSDKVGPKNRVAAFIKAVIPPRKDDNETGKVSERFRVGESSSAPITKR